MAPVLLVASRRWAARWQGYPAPPPDLPGLRVPGVERALQYGGLMLATALAYSPLAAGKSLEYTYLVYVPFIWVAVRGGLRPATIAVLLLSVIAAAANGGRVPEQDESHCNLVWSQRRWSVCCSGR